MPIILLMLYLYPSTIIGKKKRKGIASSWVGFWDTSLIQLYGHQPYLIQSPSFIKHFIFFTGMFSYFATDIVVTTPFASFIMATTHLPRKTRTSLCFCYCCWRCTSHHHDTVYPGMFRTERHVKKFVLPHPYLSTGHYQWAPAIGTFFLHHISFFHSSTVPPACAIMAAVWDDWRGRLVVLPRLFFF
jgi:hypothetical protein